MLCHPGDAMWYSSTGADSSTSVATGKAAGGQTVVIKGWFLMPFDNDINWAVNSAVDRFSVARLENYLKVTVGQRPDVCRDATVRTSACTGSSDTSSEVDLKCEIIETGAGFCSNDWTKPCRCVNTACEDCAANSVCNMLPTYSDSAATAAWFLKASHQWTFTRKPALKCVMPAVLGTDRQDLNIYWHGVKSTLSNWYQPEGPVVTSIEPSTANFKGGDVITVRGRNFGPKLAYTVANAGDVQTTGTRSAFVEVYGNSFAARCATTTYVSDSELLCTVPRLPARRIDVDKVKRTVKVSVVINAGGTRSSQTTASTLSYTSVPSYYTCDYRSENAVAKRDCFTCCRSACIVDEFAAVCDLPFILWKMYLCVCVLLHCDTHNIWELSTADSYQLTTRTPSGRFPFILQVAVCVFFYSTTVYLCVCVCVCVLFVRVFFNQP
jgi:hypothetical protein